VGDRAAFTFTSAALVYSIAIANFPDEWIYLKTSNLRLALNVASGAEKKLRASQAPTQKADAPEAVEGPKPKAWYAWLWPPNTLDLRNQDLIDDAKRKQIIEREKEDKNTKWIASIDLRGRDFIEADLTNAGVEHAEFTGANLQRARLDRIWAPKARFECVHTDFDPAKSTGCAQLHGAVATKAAVWRADARAANAPGAHLGSLNTEKSFGCIDLLCGKTAESFDELRQFMIDTVPAGAFRDKALCNIKKRLGPSLFPKRRRSPRTGTRKKQTLRRPRRSWARGRRSAASPMARPSSRGLCFKA
jgi:hypothetical protein